MRKVLRDAIGFAGPGNDRPQVECSNASMAYDLLALPNHKGELKLFNTDDRSSENGPDVAELNGGLSLKAPAVLADWTEEWMKLLQGDASFGVLTAETISPLALGLGQKNVYETGLHFSKTLGVPVIPGSSIKGAMRRAAAHFLGITEEIILAADGKSWKPDLSTEAYEKLEVSPEKKEKLLQWCALFGTTSESALIDVLPAYPLKDSVSLLMKDVVAVHHPKYYQAKKGERRTPSDRDDPIPIQFLSVAPKVTYVFAIRCHDPAWREAALELLHYTLQQQGLGGKTNAGYGYFRVNRQRSPVSQVNTAAKPSATVKQQGAPQPDLPARSQWLEATTSAKNKVVLSGGRSQDCSQLPPGIKSGVEIYVVKTSKGVRFLFSKLNAPLE